MAGLSIAPVSLTPALLGGQPATASAAELSKRREIKATAQKFEASFLSTMMQQMFEGVNTSAPFGGGPGEEMFRSLMTDAMATQMTKAGGIGIAHTVQQEMLKLQGLK
ncbi:chemotaxis protein chel [Phenylobacterium hankyongense]|uniref:Chemotaxis protein chel n=1 Tax=Phenylobacterium hankyongense TaxID=1813876 RepID=A0A328B537_9CAUL|nr:rod-binding protein [Phenylobacterium hankyongense]RAK61046.1 chemotaxis protein chel [Phenylobacterium hankyongense]